MNCIFQKTNNLNKSLSFKLGHLKNYTFNTIILLSATSTVQKLLYKYYKQIQFYISNSSKNLLFHSHLNYKLYKITLMINNITYLNKYSLILINIKF